MALEQDEIKVTPQDVREALLILLDEGNPYSTVEWDFDSQFPDVKAQEQNDFIDLVVSALRRRSNGTVKTEPDCKHDWHVKLKPAEREIGLKCCVRCWWRETFAYNPSLPTNEAL